MFDAIAFDADDTLWHNEPLYARAQEKLKTLLSSYASADVVEKKLFETEDGNLAALGYGIKSFTLSMIETAVDLSGGKIAGSEISKIIGYAREMLAAEIRLLDHAEETVSRLSGSRLMLITKGDLLDQQSKLARSGIDHHFASVHVVSDKREATYRSLLDQHGVAPERFVMVGNSLKSDIVPVLALGAHAVHVPYAITWAHEEARVPPLARGRFHELENLGQLPALIERLNGRAF